MADRHPTQITFHPATVQLGTRSFAIDVSPMRRTNPWDGARRTVELEQVTRDCLEFQPKRGWFLRHALLVLAISSPAIAFVVYSLIEEIQGNRDWGLILIWSIGSLLVLAMILAGLSSPGRSKHWVRLIVAAAG
jgi:hypothetical protein